jgi:acetylornithine deacetylase
MSQVIEPGLPDAARSGDPVALARLLVATPSVNPGLEESGAGEQQVAEITAQLLDGWGLDTELRSLGPRRANVVATIAGSGPTLLLNGHLDTVGVERMSVDPFGTEARDGRLYGRGSCDMKGGLAALLAATARLAASGARPNLIVALTADEEHASIGMADFVRTGPRADCAVVCEPTRLHVMPAHKGFVWIHARFRGRAAHGSRPDLGVDAIRHAALYVAALDDYARWLGDMPAHPLLGNPSLHAGTIRGGTAESVYPDRCDLVLERRTMPGETADDVVRELEVLLAELRAREPAVDAALEATLARPGTEVPAEAELVRGLLAAGARHGVAPVVEGMSAWVDAALLNEAGIPAVCYGPGSIDQAHTADEWIDIDEITTCADVLETFARALVQRPT